jgi:signal transduction histidine kinase
VTPVRTRPATATVAWTVAVVPAVLAVVGTALSAMPPRMVVLVDGHVLGEAALAVTCGAVAGVLVRELGRHPVAGTFAVLGVCHGLSLLVDGIVLVGDGAAATAAGWVNGWAWLPGLVVSVTVLPLVFPDGVDGWVARVLLRGSLVVLGLLVVASATAPTISTAPGSDRPNPLAVPGATAVRDAAFGLAAVAAVASVAVLVARFWRSTGLARRQLAPFVATGALVVAVVVGAGQLGRAGAVAQDLALLLLPVAAAVCVLRFHLYDLEVVVRRTVVWSLLTAGVVAGYVLVVQAVAGLLALDGRPASVIATAVVALAFGPARAWISDAVARWLYGDRSDPYGALAATSSVLAGSADPLGALHQATGDLATRMRCRGARVLRRGVLLAGGPAAGVAALVVPLRAAGEDVGVLEVLGRAGEDGFSRADQRLVLDLAPALAHAVAAVGWSEDLRRSREELVRAREEERRRLRAELHDGVGPMLAALVVQARTARRRLDRADTPAAVDVLGVLEETARQAVEDLRGVVDALRPRALDEVGLAGAVEDLAGSLGGEDLDVSLDVRVPASLPAAVESVAYRVVAEALTNAVRHARTGRVEVSLSVVGGCLVVRVRDFGVGVAGTASGSGSGLGLASMQARAEEIGGSLSVLPALPGTVVEAQLPLAGAGSPR